MEYLKKYKILILSVLIVLVVIIFSFFNKPEEVETIQVLESNTIEKEEVINTIKFEIKGAVKQTGVYEVEENARVIDAISIGGGLLKTADTSEINLSEKLVDEMIITIPYQEIEETKSIKVDIKGAIKTPGVYELKENDRIIDVIKLSGGLLDVADTSTINLSKRVFDEMVIVIPTKEEKTEKEEIVNDAVIGEEQNKNIDNLIKEDDKSTSAEDKEVEQTNKKISINTATKEQLMTLSGIGESKALAIIEYRNNKKFESIEEIMNIKGIGNSIYEKIKDYITV